MGVFLTISSIRPRVKGGRVIQKVVTKKGRGGIVWPTIPQYRVNSEIHTIKLQPNYYVFS